MTFGEKIRNLRENADMTQSDLGEKLNMTQRKVSYMENDRFEPSMGDLRAICLYFKVSADDLLDISQQDKPTK